MDDLDSCLYTGQVSHHRFTPSVHQFKYRVFSSLLDLDELPNINRLKLFSVNKFNLFSFHEKDHGRGKDNLVCDIRALLKAQRLESAGHKIKLLCYPRILGYAFNPLSVYFCYNKSDQLQVILYEVSNTFGSRHTYLFETETDGKILKQSCNKRMYVSPFMPMDTRYLFNISPPKEQVSVVIQQFDQLHHANNPKPIFTASFKGKHCNLTDKSLLKMFFQYPLMTLKVIMGIHWEAFKLWRKKLKIQPRENNVSHTISWQDKNGAIHHESL